VTRQSNPDGPKLLAFVLAGGEGSRLRPLTRHVSKPALPFAGAHRIVDFVLSNLVNSGIDRIHVLAQYRPQALAEHLARTWADKGASITLPKLGADGASARPFAGTADAVAQNLELIERAQADVVAVFAADQIYRMDVDQMLQEHLRHRADVTVATLAVAKEQSGSFGIVGVDPASRITHFREKPVPATVPGMPGHTDQVLASMGNYLFDADVLLEALSKLHGEMSDFGAHVLPQLVQTHRVLAYDFESNQVPGLHPFEQPAYWRDVGTLDAYFEAHEDVLGPLPRFRIANPLWPIHGAAAGGLRARCDEATLRCSAVAADGIVGRAVLDHANLQRGVRVDDGAIVERSIVMEHATIGPGARLRDVIVEPGCEVPAGEAIGYDSACDGQRFEVSEKGVVVVTRERCVAPAYRVPQQVSAVA
jgi:glucose-1-phosphate adenylyltransferase